MMYTMIFGTWNYIEMPIFFTLLRSIFFIYEFLRATNMLGIVTFTRLLILSPHSKDGLLLLYTEHAFLFSCLTHWLLAVHYYVT